VSLASSADGQTFLAASKEGSLYLSMDGGFTFYDRASGVSVLSSAGAWSGLGVSEDGNLLVAVSDEGLVYSSSNGGVTWLEHNPSIGQGVHAVAVSGDGTVIFVVDTTGTLHTITPYQAPLTSTTGDSTTCADPRCTVLCEAEGGGQFANPWDTTGELPPSSLSSPSSWLPYVPPQLTSYIRID